MNDGDKYDDDLCSVVIDRTSMGRNHNATFDDCTQHDFRFGVTFMGTSQDNASERPSRAF
jgi:hypothetical protein